jgi:hypothetical protein
MRSRRDVEILFLLSVLCWCKAEGIVVVRRLCSGLCVCVNNTCTDACLKCFQEALRVRNKSVDRLNAMK